jgi:hypothetical protein
MSRFFIKEYKEIEMTTMMDSGESLEWFILLIGLITIPIVLLIGKLFIEYRKQYSQRWLTESLVGSVVERMFPHHKFVKTRPDFLRNPATGRNLELDLYCKDLNVAIEYNGRQHYQYVKFFHGSDESKFARQKERDKFKKQACESAGITLVVVPYTVAKDDLYTYIYKQMLESGNELVRAVIH